MQNPNRTKNRVPTDRELTSLRAIASRKEELSNSINAQLSEAQATYDEIMVRHEMQMAVLESIQSELHAAKQHADVLQAHKAIVDNDRNDIRAVLHPIRRMPVETLRHIFEETVDISPRTKWWQATQQSHVCQYWRIVALNAPTLWTRIAVDFRKSTMAITEYWNWAMKRVKAVPVDVHFINFGGKLETHTAEWEQNESQLRKVAACSLLQIPAIRKLSIDVDSTCSTPEAFAMITEFPTGRLERLRLSGPDDESVSEIMSWDWSGFLHRFPPLTFLQLEFLDVLSFSQLKPFSALQDLYIGPSTEFDTLELLRLCPKLERLTIQAGRASYTSHQTHAPVTIPTLNFLDISEESIFSWDTPLHFSSLSTLKFAPESGNPPDDFFRFLTNHPSISDLDLYMYQLDLTRLATAAPQITKLTLSFDEGSLDGLLDWTMTSLQGPAFPQLEILDLGHIVLELGEFDRFIQRRCLPATHERSELPNGLLPLQKWIVNLPKGYVGSQFLAEATHMGKKGNHMTSLSWL
ncbi:hypothetical protein M408DRAFT_26990 [Serendipita vermifera MAFF 305830]|uniref:Uncharacterized protein n=1 Tax=Serendipita vermifera MAFF 305830 TaxID=933852 RepID=A0A0C2WDG8_SERVB|nr:hypothetical protein M408DRAFT_26990 [Serendipita vermifera MAFF 305830]